MRTIDTRDLYTRKCELEELRDAVESAREELEEAEEAFESANEEDAPDAESAVDEASQNLSDAEADYGPDEQEELVELEELESEIGNLRYGETLILESDFEEYARELAEDITSGFREASWPFNCIDWEQAAKELAMDYTTVTYQGDEYLVHA